LYLIEEDPQELLFFFFFQINLKKTAVSGKWYSFFFQLIVVAWL